MSDDAVEAAAILNASPLFQWLKDFYDDGYGAIDVIHEMINMMDQSFNAENTLRAFGFPAHFASNLDDLAGWFRNVAKH